MNVDRLTYLMLAFFCVKLAKLFALLFGLPPTLAVPLRDVRINKNTSSLEIFSLCGHKIFTHTSCGKK